ncbi:Tetratricopeptide repeat-containing protein [Aeromonas sp. RU39B]|jgi:tetratricopeptide (TPR) repeat protein|uniref:tetratricopeptide repeat protein n=1 Tax=Aeromonas sp. RU39B TaxID=1907416 RepID=UPI0009569F5F|nr:tetratricopeptide repeat protein [Aeromonas sp. RU39B]SIQ84144.1 Tetratricopeptide repeat-containing protein [Aeromonas sp. RU39B]
MKSTLMILTALIATPVLANDVLPEIQNGWAVCQYKTAEKQKESCLTSLSQQADQASSKEAFRTDLLIWSAIVKSTLAGAKGGLGALSLVKDAKVRLELAIKQDPKALDGSAYTSLGSLYYQVPGWPVGFGDDEKAEQLLKQALTINPNGIDPNYFYADFLLDQGRKADAKTYFEKALAAAPRAGRELADEGRRNEIKAKLAGL